MGFALTSSVALPDNKPGLIIDDTGLVDNSGGLSAGDILLSDIEEISVMQIQKQKMIMIYVINPQDYIDRQTSFLKRKGMQLNYKT
ncbi:MAG: STM3941 family protein [Flavisolibacter sp.]